MSHRTSKDQPPAYTSEDYRSSTRRDGRSRHSTAPYRSTQASRLSQATENGIYTTSQYLELTFSVMVHCRGTFQPVVVAIDEDYDTLLEDLDSVFGQIVGNGKSIGLSKIKVVWERGWKHSWSSEGEREWHSIVTTGNMTAMLRLLKAQGDMSYIEIS